MDMIEIGALCGFLSFFLWIVYYICIGVGAYQAKNRAELKMEIIEEIEKYNPRKEKK